MHLPTDTAQDVFPPLGGVSLRCRNYATACARPTWRSGQESRDVNRQMLRFYREGTLEPPGEVQVIPGFENRATEIVVWRQESMRVAWELVGDAESRAHPRPTDQHVWG